MSPNKLTPIVDNVLPPDEFTARQKTIFKEMLICIPGPTNYSNNVKKALTEPVASLLCKEYYEVLEDIKPGLRYMFQTKSRAVTCAGGSGHAGMETVLVNLLAPGNKLMVALSGAWDGRAVSVARRHGIEVVELQKDYYNTYTLQQLEEGLRLHRPNALFITHGDSSSGTLQPLEGLGELCESYNAFLLVDAVASVGGVPFFMDEWKIDAVYSASQKVLGGPAGLSPLAFSDKAVAHMLSRTTVPPHYLDALEMLKQWNCFGDGVYYHHTLSAVLLNALRACLEDLVRCGLESNWHRIEQASKRFQNQVTDIPHIKNFIPNPDNRLPTVVALELVVPKQIPVIIQYFKDNGILIIGGVGPTASRAIRVGFMGVTATNDIADLLAFTLRKAFENINELVDNFDQATVLNMINNKHNFR